MSTPHPLKLSNKLTNKPKGLTDLAALNPKTMHPSPLCIRCPSFSNLLPLLFSLGQGMGGDYKICIMWRAALGTHSPRRSLTPRQDETNPWRAPVRRRSSGGLAVAPPRRAPELLISARWWGVPSNFPGNLLTIRKERDRRRAVRGKKKIACQVYVWACMDWFSVRRRRDMLPYFCL